MRFNLVVYIAWVLVIFIPSYSIKRQVPATRPDLGTALTEEGRCELTRLERGDGSRIRLWYSRAIATMK